MGTQVKFHAEWNVLSDLKRTNHQELASKLDTKRYDWVLCLEAFYDEQIEASFTRIPSDRVTKLLLQTIAELFRQNVKYIVINANFAQLHVNPHFIPHFILRTAVPLSDEAV